MTTTSLWWTRRLAVALGVTTTDVDAAPARLRSLDLVTHRPWQPGQLDGVRQLLPVPRRDRPCERPDERTDAARTNAPVHIAAILARLGIATDRQKPVDSGRR